MSAFRKFVNGFLAFQKNSQAADPELFARLSLKQKPPCMVIGCCDSRVDPAILSRAAPGELFIVRNVANLTPPYEPDTHYHSTSAALEFGVTSLEVEYIIVLGHAHCGGVRALLTNDPNIDETHPFISRWMRLAEPARRKTLMVLPDAPVDEQASFCEKEVVKVSLNNLMTFPCIAEGVAVGRLKLRGLYFDLGTGTLFLYKPDKDCFDPIGPDDVGD
ncbi:carbonic anhydrase [Azospirillaceae bacterium]